MDDRLTLSDMGKQPTYELPDIRPEFTSIEATLLALSVLLDLYDFIPDNTN